MAFATDKVPAQADLIGEWRYKTWTIGGIIGMSAEMLVDETNDNFSSYSLPGRSANVVSAACAV